MYKTKMIKVYISSFQLCIFSLIINLLVLGIQTPRALSKPNQVIAENPESQPVEANTAQTALEPAILSEINRVRTNPQGYAQWLEEQRQYYDGIWLKLPGEKPIRTNKGLKALEEAIAFLKEQQPLSPLSNSEKSSAIATTKLENFATANNIQNISYGRVTAKGIVMNLVVDDLFPDRRRRKSLLSPDIGNTGVVCKPDPRYAKVCAIAYSDVAVDIAAAEPQATTETSAETSENAITASQSEAPPSQTTSEPQATTEIAESTVTENQPEVSESQTTSEPRVTTETSSPNNTDSVAETLPQPPQPQLPPTSPSISDVTSTSEEEASSSSEVEESVAKENDEDLEISQADNNDDEEELNEEELEEEELEAENNEELDEEEESESADNQDETDVEVLEAEEENSEEQNSDQQVAINSDNSLLLENVERGTLEEGDRVIAEDSSFYDSYPLEGQEGDSFTIYLESDEFDAFVALIDDQGNILAQNDDISEENSNSRIRVTIPQDGIYNVIVNAYDEGGKGKYILTVSR